LFIINSSFLVNALPVLSKLSRHISYLYLRDPKGSSYKLHSGVKPDNFVAMVKAARKYGKYLQ